MLKRSYICYYLICMTLPLRVFVIPGWEQGSEAKDYLGSIYDRTFARIANDWKTSTMSTKISVTVVWYGSQNVSSEAQFSARYFNIKIRSCRVCSTFYSQIQGETKVINVWKKCLKLWSVQITLPNSKFIENYLELLLVVSWLNWI